MVVNEHSEIPHGHYCYSARYIESAPSQEAKMLAQILGADEREADEISRTRVITTPCPYWGRDTNRPGPNGVD